MSDYEIKMVEKDLYRRIKRNAAKCKLCGDVIESKTVHDFVSCSCGEIFVDGGLEYLRRGAKNPDNFIPKNDYEDPNPNFVPAWQYFSKYYDEWRDAKSTDSRKELEKHGYKTRNIGEAE